MATKTIQAEATIEADRERVWAVLAKLDGFADYSPMVRSTTMLSPAREGVGAERRCDAYRPGHIDERVTVWEPTRRLALEVIGGMPITGTGVWELVGDGPTTVRFTLTYRPKWGPFGSVMDRLMMHREMTNGFAANLAGLKAYVETGVPVTRDFAPSDVA